MQEAAAGNAADVATLLQTRVNSDERTDHLGGTGKGESCPLSTTAQHIPWHTPEEQTALRIPPGLQSHTCACFCHCTLFN